MLSLRERTKSWLNRVSLKEFLNHKDGTYVAMNMRKESKMMLDNFLKMTLDPMPRVDPDSYHVTIIYSRTPVPQAEKFKSDELIYSAVASKFEIFPTKNDGKCLVLKLDFPFAKALNKELSMMGATSDYAEYKPHVTIAYDTDIDIDPTKLSLPAFELHFQGIDVKPLDTDYTPPQRK